MRYIAMGAASAALATAATLGSTTPAQANHLTGGSLVNVEITNVLNNNEVNVQIPITAAANICGQAAVGVIADLEVDGVAECDARSGNQELVITS